MSSSMVQLELLWDPHGLLHVSLYSGMGGREQARILHHPAGEGGGGGGVIMYDAIDVHSQTMLGVAPRAGKVAHGSRYIKPAIIFE